MDAKTGTTRYEVTEGIAVLTLENPPVNGLGHGVRSALADGLAKALGDAGVAAIVIRGSGPGFSGGADIREFNTPRMLAEPSLRTLVAMVEASPKPIVAALHGVAMGGGLELPLACHYRVAAPGTKVALPEVKLGLIPGAGGTQRLPRVIGVEAALNMIVSGEPVAAEKLAPAGLFDEMIEGDLAAGALAFARRIRDRRPLPLVRHRKASHPQAEAFLQFARNTVGAKAGRFPAPAKCIDAVAASVSLPFDDGIRVERDAFVQLLHGPESRALRHAFFGERAAAKIPDVPADTALRPVARVAVIGAGTMGSGIAMNFLNAGLPVTLLESGQEPLDRGVAAIRGNYESTVRKGKLAAEKAAERLALLKPTLSWVDLREADLVIEAVFEEMGVKEAVFRRADEIAKPGAILATNTSTLDVNRIAAATKRPQDVVGMHFFSPANVMKLLEVVRGRETAKDVLATVMGVARRIRKTAVVSGVCDGFIGNRMLRFYLRQANALLEEGATPAQVDRAMEKFGMAMGPFRVGDLAGNDIGWAVRKRWYAEDPKAKRMPIGDRICEMGRFGQKTGAGWYRYEPGRRDPIPDPVVDGVIEEVRRSLGITARAISDEEIVGRCVFALVNVGARILEEGIAARASDIDMVYLTGYGFPAHRGGPMLHADMVGLAAVAQAMRGYRAATGDDFWEPAPLLARLAAEGGSFNGGA